MKLASLPREEMPRERIRLRGASALSVPELLAVLLRTGSRGKDVLELASELLHEFGGAKGLARATEEEMLAIPGLGDAKACVLLAALELGKRLEAARNTPQNGKDWRAGLDEIARDLAFEEREFIVGLHVRRNGSIIVMDRISFGGTEGAYLDVKYLLRRAVRMDSHGLVLVHNHPDGSLQPSREDRCLTDFLFRRTKILDIHFLGHFVVANGESLSISLPGEI